MNSVFWTAIIVCPLTPMIKKAKVCFLKKMIYYYYTTTTTTTTIKI